MYLLDPNVRRAERISIDHSAGETIITHSGTGTFENFSLKATITDNKIIKFDTSSLRHASDKTLFVFSRAAGEVFSYWRIAVRPYTPGAAWRDPALVAALSPVLGEKSKNGVSPFDETGIDQGNLSFASERNGYLENVNQSVAYGCALNKRWAKEDCVLNIFGWVLYDKESGIKIEQDLIYTLLTGDGLGSGAAATWREKSACQRTSN